MKIRPYILYIGLWWFYSYSSVSNVKGDESLTKNITVVNDTVKGIGFNGDNMAGLVQNGFEKLRQKHRRFEIGTCGGIFVWKWTQVRVIGVNENITNKNLRKSLLFKQFNRCPY